MLREREREGGEGEEREREKKNKLVIVINWEKLIIYFCKIKYSWFSANLFSKIYWFLKIFYWQINKISDEWNLIFKNLQYFK